MGRKSDYTKIQEGPKQITYESISEKFGKEPMSAQEFAIYLSKVAGDTNITEKTIRNYIKEICDRSHGQLTPNDFRQKSIHTNSKYIFEPNYHGILLTLMNTDYFDSRKNDRKLRTREELYRQLISNIGKYLPDEDKKTIQANPAFTSAALESRLSSQINMELTVLLRNLYHLDPFIRYQFMVDFIDKLSNFRENMNRAESRTMSTKIVYSHKLDNSPQQKFLFDSMTLEEFLISYLALQVHNQPFESSSDKELPSLPAMALISLLFPGAIGDDSQIIAVTDYINSITKNDARYKMLIGKAQIILDQGDPLESQIYESLEKTIRLQLVQPKVDKNEYGKILKYIESCIAKNHWDILNEFAKLGDDAYTPDEIEAIQKAKNNPD